MLREVMYWQDTIFRLESLLVYRNILEDDIVEDFLTLMHHMVSNGNNTDKLYYNFAALLMKEAERDGMSGNIFSKYICGLFLRDENPFTLACERRENLEKHTLHDLVMRDMRVLQYFCGFDLQNLCENIGYEEKLYDYSPSAAKGDGILDDLIQARTPEDKYSLLASYHNELGAGEMPRSSMFRLTENCKLRAIPNPDPIALTDLYIYESQKQSLLDNIEAFLAGYRANNVLLAGSRGNGKSSCVKALVNEYKSKGLRLIEITKEQITLLPELIEKLSMRGKHFLIFMDDLSYDYQETEYKNLKSLLEGGASVTPANILFFATSNRRHIVHENWQEREEIHAADTRQEKISLHDRFGLTVFFPNLEQDDYLKIVTGLAQKEKIVIDEGFLKEQAIKWAAERKNFSGRTATQFVNQIIWEMNKE